MFSPLQNSHRTRTKRQSGLALQFLEDRTPLDASSTVANLYQLFLNRAPDPAGLASWSASLNASDAIGNVTSSIANSPEAIANHIDDLYSNLLARAPDNAGLSHWVNLIESGGNFNQVEASILASDEFFQDAGGTNAGFLAALYQGALEREIDTAGAAFWATALATDGGASRYVVAKTVVNSTEANVNVVRGIYHEILGRDPDLTELNSGVLLVHAGGDDPTVNLQVSLAVSTQAQNLARLPNIPIGPDGKPAPGIYVQSHEVFGSGKEHTFLRIVADDGSTFTIGAGADFAINSPPIDLVAGRDRPTDETDPVDYQFKLTLNRSLADEIATLVSLSGLEKSGATNDTREPYFFVPISAFHAFNSNSYVAGLLNAAGIPLPPDLIALDMSNSIDISTFSNPPKLLLDELINLIVGDEKFPGIMSPIPKTDFNAPATTAFDPDNDGDDDTGVQLPDD